LSLRTFVLAVCRRSHPAPRRLQRRLVELAALGELPSVG
jgi:hypothetical protein